MYYGTCASNCSQAASWQAVQLTIGGSVMSVPTVGVTQDGRPRILMASDGNQASAGGLSQGLYYLECTSNCTSPSSWSVVQLRNTNPDTIDAGAFPRPHLAFAISPSGKAATAVQGPDPQGIDQLLWVYYCSANCSVASSWTSPTIASSLIGDLNTRSMVFGAENNLQLLTTEPSNGGYGLVFHECTGDCSVAGNWAALPLWSPLTADDYILAEIAATAQGGTRVAFYADDSTYSPTAPAIPHAMYYFTCDSACTSATTGWSEIQLSSALLPDRSASVGFGLALNTAGLPTIAYASDTSSGYVVCTSNCNTTSGVWQSFPSLDAGYLNTNETPLVPTDCTSASWNLYVGPSLVLDAQARPMMGLSAQAHASGGACGAGSAATVTAGFIVETN